MIRVNLIKSKVAKAEFNSLQKAEMIFTAVVAVALVVMILLPQ